MHNSISIATMRDARRLLIKPGAGTSVLYLDPVSLMALDLPVPTLVAMAITESGLIIIGPEFIVKSCRDPTPG
jgi:hypothetical protein